jgi:hypothetical protein
MIPIESFSVTTSPDGEELWLVFVIPVFLDSRNALEIAKTLYRQIQMHGSNGFTYNAKFLRDRTFVLMAFG